ncbi:hypothetical protein ACIPSA_41420 [Streptomyces sp. NPDC086549]|uniref:hypothetical protein n=1 Tax=Streptomyces sp. NPDC086549 TaxID=3365752 RepID=UPI00382E595C
MVPTLTEPLSGALHELLTARCLQERNKEIALALVAAGNQGEVNRLTRHWADAGGPRGRSLPAGLRLTCESVLADGDGVALRVTVRAGRAAWSLVAELRFDTAGRVAEFHDVLAPRAAAS